MRHSITQYDIQYLSKCYETKVSSSWLLRWTFCTMCEDVSLSFLAYLWYLLICFVKSWTANSYAGDKRQDFWEEKELWERIWSSDSEDAMLREKRWGITWQNLDLYKWINLSFKNYLGGTLNKSQAFILNKKFLPIQLPKEQHAIQIDNAVVTWQYID